MRTPQYCIFLVTGLVLGTVSGCGRSESPQPTAAPEPSQQGSVQPVPTHNAPVADPAADQAAQDLLSQAQTAQQARQYDRSAELLLAVQRQQAALNDAEAAAYTKQMRAFQQDLAGGVAAGDPKAIAAAKKLRAAASH